MTNQPNRQLFEHVEALLQNLYEKPENHLITTLAMMVTGVFLGHHVQLWEIALWVPLPIQLTSIVRRFERFVANPRVDVVWSSDGTSHCHRQAFNRPAERLIFILVAATQGTRASCRC